MSSSFFDRAYGTTAQYQVWDLYEDWAATYDADLTENGYATPARWAAALALHLRPMDAPILDFACGTGLSGAALTMGGFRTIDGVDISAAMLEAARERGIYRQLIRAEPSQMPSARRGKYAAITAMGALSPGAAPPEFFDSLPSCLAPGGLFVVAYNDHTLADPDYISRLQGALESGNVRTLFDEHGHHIKKLGSKSTVYVIEKL